MSPYDLSAEPGRYLNDKVFEKWILKKYDKVIFLWDSFENA